MQIRKSGKDGKIFIDNVDYIPVYCYDKGAGIQNRYELIDMRSAIGEYENGNTENISSSLYKTLKTELANTVKVLGNPITREQEENKN